MSNLPSVCEGRKCQICQVFVRVESVRSDQVFVRVESVRSAKCL